MRRLAVTTACLGAAASAAAPTAVAATTPVSMGVPRGNAPALKQLDGDVNAFFPSTVSVHAGDRVRFVPSGFHSLDFVPRGGEPLALFPPGAPIAQARDAAGEPFWFAGAPGFTYAPELFVSRFGERFTYDPRRRIASGLPVVAKPKPIIVTFPKAGRYAYVCDVHVGMRGVVDVRPRGARLPHRPSATTQLRRAVRTLGAINRLPVPAGPTIRIGNGGPGGVESYAFAPAQTTVARGTTLTFTMPARSTEVHTVTTGPGDPLDTSTYLGAIADSYNGRDVSPLAVYASERPGSAPAQLTPALHGNGFWSAGALDAYANPGLPGTAQVTMAEPGTYAFFCLIHPFMKATVTVT